MHVLIIPSWYANTYNPLSGVFFKEQAEALAKYGNKIGVIAIQEISIKDIFKQKKLDFSNKHFTENGVYTYSLQYPAIPKLNGVRRKIKITLFVKLFEDYIKQHGLPDIIHLHSFMAGELAIYIKEKYNIPYIVTEHNTGFARNLVSEKDLVRAKKGFENSAYNIAVSKQFRDLLQNKFTLNFNYVANIVNIDFFNIKKSNKKDTYSFINIAFLDKKKNQDMLIRAFANAFTNKPKIKLTIVGDGPEYSNLNNLIKELDMENQISLYGRANREEVKIILQKSDAFVLSSKYETFGVVIIEAMACGLPVVATKCGGPESIINSEKVGLLSEIDENKLSEKLLEMYNNRLIFDSNYIRKYVENNFSEQVIAKQLLSIYQTVAGTS